MLGNECFVFQYYRMKNMFIMLLAMLYVVSAYAQDFEVDGLSYQVTKSPDGESPGEVEVTGGEIKEEIEFPETVTYNSATYMVTSIGSNAFRGRSNSGNFTKKYIIPGTVRSIGNSAFYDNYYLEEVEFNEGLQTIGVDAFGYNFALKEIRIPSTVTAIEDRAFRTNQQNQATISCLAATPPANLGSETFQGRTYATLHVVGANVEAYQEAEYWKDFSVISGDILNINRCSSPVITCDNNILTISCKTEGAAIYYTTDGSVPDENALRYTSPISYTTNQIIRAIAISEGYESSSVKNFYDKEQIENVTDAQGIKYTLKQADDGSFYYSVTGHSDELNAEIVIPAALGGCPVKIIKASAFGSCFDLTSVTLPNSITSIGENAFYGCSALTSITLSSQLTAIGRETFQGCTSLSSITIPDGVTTIGEQAFKECSSLSSITIPNSVTSIGERAFWGCNGLTSITLPSSVTCEGYDPFNGTSLNDVKIVILDYSEFCNNTGIKVFGYSVPIHLLDNEGNEITEYVIPEGVTSICDRAFFFCSNLSSITIPEGVTTIGGEAFRGCSSLSSIMIPSSVTTMGWAAFSGCSDLQMVTSEISTPFAVDVFGGSNASNATLIVPKGSRTDYKSTDGWGFAFIYEEGETLYDREQNDEQGLKYTLMQADEGSVYYSVTGHSDEMDTEIIIPTDLDGCPVKTIEENAFSSCTDLTSVTIPNSITSIGRGAFYGCGLASVTIPNSVTSIGDDAFYECRDLTSVKIGNGIASIGYRLFSDCENLTSVKMGKNVSSIGKYAFNGCSSLASITLPDVLESIGDFAFRVCGLTSVSIPGSVQTIGQEAFRGCGNLATVGLEDGLTAIGKDAFTNCALASITIPNSVTSIGEAAFTLNYNLTTAILGDGITEISDRMFKQCTALTSVTIPDDVTDIGREAFWYCTSLTSIKLPESLTSLGESVFYGCPLKSIELPNSFTVIPENLFSNNNFQYIKLGNNVKSIGKSAFGSYEPVLEIGTSTPPSIASDAFPNVEYLSDLTVIVPNAKAETAYRKKAVWEEMTFSNQDNISEVTVDTPGDLSFELITECNMMPAKVVGLKVNGTINADDFTQMLVNMKSLLRLDLSDCDITEIPDEALSGKTQLKELTLPTNLQAIGANAFHDCPYLTGELVIPSTVTSIGDYAFEGTDYSSVKLPNALKTIGNYAFNNLPIEQRLVLPGKVTSVGTGAFAGTKITGLSIPDGVKSIGAHAFADTPIQGHLTIPDGITDLGEGAFMNTQISTAFLPNSVTTLSQGLFQGCSNLNLLYIPDNYTDMSNYVFDGCDALETLRLSANTATMGEYSFQGTPLEYIKVPSKVEVLSRGVLKNCKNLASLSLPANLKSLEAEALTGCTALRNISVEALTPPTIKDRSVLRGINTDLCLISIPTQSYRDYALAPYWGQFVQMRNDIAVETVGNGEIAFESVVEEEEEDVVYEAPVRADVRRVAASIIGGEPELISMIEVDADEAPLSSDVRRVAAFGIRRAPQLASKEDAMTYANNGSSIYAPQDAKVLLHITPAEGEKLISATRDGEDIMPSIVNGIYTTTADKKNVKLKVIFSKQSVLAGDVNSDGNINVTDVGMVIDHILEHTPSGFVEAAADLNNDGDVNVTDVGLIIEIILSDGTSSKQNKKINAVDMLDPQ